MTSGTYNGHENRLIPSESAVIIYTIKANIANNYTLPSCQVNYENPLGANFSSNSNSVPFLVKEYPELDLNSGLNKSIYSEGEMATLTVTVIEKGGTNVGGVNITWRVKSGTDSIIHGSFQTDSNGKGLDTFNVPTTPSSYTVEINASKTGYISDNDLEVFDVKDSLLPTVPTPLLPAQGTYVNQSTPQLTWMSSTDIGSGLSHYVVQINMDQNFTSPVLIEAIVNDTYYKPTSGLVDGIYYWRVKAVDKALNSSNWSEMYLFTVDTLPPTVTGVNPTDGQQSIAVDTEMRITFSEPMLRGHTESAFSLNPATQGSFKWENNTLIFTPTDNLSGNTSYTISITTVACDLGYNSLANIFTSTFGTGLSTVIYVDADVTTGAIDGLGVTWANAFTNLQDALNAASNSAGATKEIHVAQGTYKPDQGNGITPGDRSATFQLLDGLAIKGGYAGFGQPDPDARNVDSYRTILSGDLNGDDGPNFANNGENSYHVITSSGCDNTAVIEGFTITAGNADSNTAWDEKQLGGGVYCYQGCPIVANCTFHGNSANKGGALYGGFSDFVLINCTFQGNYASAWGGGVMNHLNNSQITDCKFIDNSAFEGGAIDNLYSSPKLTRCFFQGNSARGYGGGVSNIGGQSNIQSSTDLIDCIFSGNSAESGAGIYNRNNNSPTAPTVSIINCTFAANSAHDGSAITCGYIPPHQYPYNLEISNCILWDEGAEIWNNSGSTINIRYSCVQDENPDDAIVYPGIGDIDDDPMFVRDPNDGGDGWGDDPTTPGVDEGANDDFGDLRFQSSSQCIDAGDPDYVPEPNEADLDGNPRIVGDQIDMGAYEYQSFTYSLTITAANGSVTKTPDKASYDHGETVTLEAIPDTGYSFTGWSGDLSGSTNPTSINMDSDKSVTASFSAGNNPPVANAGSDQSITDSDGDGSEQIMLDGTASADQDGTIESYVWTEGSTQIATGMTPTVTLSVGQHTITLTVTDDDGLTGTDTVVITVDATGANTHILTVTAANGSVTKTPDKASYDHGETVTLEALPDSGYHFTSWSGDLSGSTNPASIIMDSDKVVTANFSADSADDTPPGVSNCSPQPDLIQVPLNSLLTFHVADADEGVDGNTVTIQINGDVVYTGSTDHYSSQWGHCRRTGTNADYAFMYQANEIFDFEQKITVTVNASDLAGNVMNEYNYSFWTEMRSFAENKKVNSSLDNLDCARPATARDSSGNIWVVWHAGPAGSRDIYLAELAEGASNFGGSVRLTTSPADQCNPAMAVGGDDRLYVAWQDNRRGNWDVYISTSAEGVNWSTEIRVTDSNDNEQNPAIAIDSSSPDRAHIVWQDSRAGNWDIYMASSSDTFATKTVSQITSHSSGQLEPAIAATSDNTVYVMWTDQRNSSSDIYGWDGTQILPVVRNANNQSSPAIAAEEAGLILHLLWTDDTPGGQDMYYAATNGLPGSPLTGTSIIDNSSGADQLEPAIFVEGSTGSDLAVFACWQDWRNAGNSGDTDLYFVRTNSGSGTNVFVGDDGTNSNQGEPAIGIDSYGHPYLVWSDDRNSKVDIYYAGSTFTESVPLYSELVSAAAGATVGADPASIDDVEDVSVVVPAGACSCDVEITISRIGNPQEFGGQRLSAYDFGPSGMQFNPPVTITIPYSVSGPTNSPAPYWFNSLTGMLSQHGITNIRKTVISSTLHALSFHTTHSTPFYIVGSADGPAPPSGDGGGGGGGCSLSPTGEGSLAEFILPYIGTTVMIVVLKLKDSRNRRRLCCGAESSRAGSEECCPRRQVDFRARQPEVNGVQVE